MTDDYETTAASIIAHDTLLKMIISNLMDPMPGQWPAFVEAVLKVQELPIPPGMVPDLDSADRLAGVSIGAAENMKRIVLEARDAARRGGCSTI